MLSDGSGVVTSYRVAMKSMLIGGRIPTHATEVGVVVNGEGEIWARWPDRCDWRPHCRRHRVPFSGRWSDIIGGRELKARLPDILELI